MLRRSISGIEQARVQVNREFAATQGLESEGNDASGIDVKWRAGANGSEERVMASILRSAIRGAFLSVTPPFFLGASSAAAQPWRILVFGDSISSGFGLPETQGFPSVMKQKLLADGYDVMV